MKYGSDYVLNFNRLGLLPKPVYGAMNDDTLFGFECSGGFQFVIELVEGEHTFFEQLNVAQLADIIIRDLKDVVFDVYSSIYDLDKQLWAQIMFNKDDEVFIRFKNKKTEVLDLVLGYANEFDKFDEDSFYINVHKKYRNELDKNYIAGIRVDD